MYAIAEYLTPEARRAAVLTRYERDDDEDGYLRTEDGRCPLGVALEALGLTAPAGWGRWHSPTADEVGEALSGGSDSRALMVEGAAIEFIDDWDANQIEDLAAALGVETSAAD